VAYLTTREITGSFLASLLAGISILLDLSLLISSRVILTDTFLYMYQALGIFLLFKQYRSEPLTVSWLLYLISSSFFFGAALSVKWTVLGLLGIFAFRHVYYLWEIFPHVSFDRFRKIVAAYVVAASIAVGIYMFSFYMHFAVCTKTGPGDPYHGGDDRYLVEFEGSPASTSYTGPRLSFLSKFSILHKVMYSANSGVQEHHASGSRWLNWPVNEVGVFSWTRYADGTTALIYLAGNPAVWWTCLALFAVWPLFLFYRLVVSKVALTTLDETRIREGVTLLAAHLVSWVPFALIKRSQFIYHYIPAFYLTVLISGILLDFLLRGTPRSYAKVVIFLTVVYGLAFWYWSAWCYGYAQTGVQQDHRRWIATWM
jgi:dolichyl-phosphate-mannose--protein O-mannosyl transferase